MTVVLLSHKKFSKFQKYEKGYFQLLHVMWVQIIPNEKNFLNINEQDYLLKKNFQKIPPEENYS